VTPVSKAGVPHGETYVVCLDCGKQFAYDLSQMRIGKPIDHSHDACVLPPEQSKTDHKKLKFAFWASVPLAVVIGAALKGPKGSKEKEPPRARGVADSDSGKPE
jgi:hypothetical protein